MSNLYALKHNPSWTEYYLYDLADWINGLVFRKINFSDNGLPVIKIAELKNGISAQTKYTDGTYDEKYRLSKGDLLFSWSGSPETSIDAFWFESETGWLNQHIFKVVAKEIVTKEYLFYLLKYAKPNFVDIAKNKQTTGLGHVTGADLKRIKVSIPSIEEQVRIVSSLKPIDDKIELNQQINQSLEQIAKAIFKSWFVAFEPVNAKMAVLEAGGTAEQAEFAAMSAISAKDEAALVQLQADQPEAYAELVQTAALFPSAMEESEHGEIPNGWKYEPVINSAEYINGAAYKNMHFSNAPDAKPVIKIAELKNGITDNTKFTNIELGDKFKLNTRDILFSWSGSPETSIDTFIWTGGEAWLNQHIFKVVNDTEEDRCFTYWLLKFLKPTFIDIAKNKQTTGLGHVTRKDMERLHYCKPNDEAMSLFFKSAGTILSKIENNLIENLTLAESRDELLPKLLSGDLPITNTEVA